MDLREHIKLEAIIKLHIPHYNKTTYTDFEVCDILKTILTDIMQEFGC